jgi:hypothetical protein
VSELLVAFIHKQELKESPVTIITWFEVWGVEIDHFALADQRQWNGCDLLLDGALQEIRT